MNRLLFLFIVIFSINVFASSGTLKQNSIIECNGEYFGNHGNPLHWHKAKKVNNMWVSDGGIVEIPSCYIKPVNTFEEAKLSKCIDGDTARFIINNEDNIVRFLAINTPEVKSSLKDGELYGEEASNYTCNELKKAKKIILEYDSNSSKKDKYGRVLAFVYVDDVLLQSKLIAKGYAKIDYIYGDYNHLDDLREIEEKARSQEIGVWSKEEIHADVLEKDSENENIYYLKKIFNYIWQFLYNIINKIFA